MADACRPKHDFFTALLTFGLCVGLIVSYLPQHFRIIHNGTSEGISPWFLLLGSTSTAAGMLNLFIMQWGIIKCCRYVTSLSCLEMTAGEFQVGLQWLMFAMILVLYIMYYPRHLKYNVDTNAAPSTSGDLPRLKAPSKSVDWRFSILVSWLTAAHFVFIVIVSLVLLSKHPVPPSRSPTAPLPPQLYSWAMFLGVSSALLAAVQYMPQLVHTYRLKLVGALSIPMMCIQSPGAILMVLSIALRPGTNWTSWITYAVAGIMQGSLLFMCVLWKIRQHKLGIDDFGHPIAPQHRPSPTSAVSEYEEVPGLVTSDSDEEDPKALTRALAHALDDAVSSDVRSGGVSQVPEIRLEGQPLESPTQETTPLLGGRKDANKSGWRNWFG